jgi:hypothetical protein
MLVILEDSWAALTSLALELIWVVIGRYEDAKKVV